jgi:hypothetical protein
MKLLRERVIRFGLVAAVAVAGAVGLTSAPSTAVDQAEAQVLAPFFQLPIPCGQRWTTATHSGHADPDMLDMVSAGGTTLGTPVLASASGTVSQSFYSSSGGEMIVIDHGGGWQTRYLHMTRRLVGVGAGVGQGQQIGNVGSTGASTGPHLHYEQKLNGAVVQATINGRLVPRTWSYNQHFEVSANGCGGRYWVDTFADAPGYSSPGGTRTGTLYKGTNYVYCKVWGPEVRVGDQYNHWWMRTDLDTGSPWQNQYVSAYYLSRWGNDEARDNNGTVLPNC